jgi:hypothetical protein
VAGPTADFIGVYDDTLPASFCTRLIDYFEESGVSVPGQTGHGLDVGKKDSDDLNLSQEPALLEMEREVLVAVVTKLVDYTRRFPFMLVGALTPSLPHPRTGRYVELSPGAVRQLDDSQVARLLLRLFRLGMWNLQRYRRGTGHYRHWHSEHFPSPHDPQQASLHRVLFLLLYLNDVEEGGETAFFHQDRKVRPKTGRLVVAPAGFSHTHRGEVPKTSDKYVLTSWLMFQPAAKLYG